jgi:hypothetical protein
MALHANTQNNLLLSSLMEFYKDKKNLDSMMQIINGESKISLRIIDWFVTNYAKKYYTVYDMPGHYDGEIVRFKVYHDYKLKLKAYSKKRFDPFCRWERISIPYDNEKYMETTLGQMCFFRWLLSYNVLDFIKDNYDAIEADMNERNSNSASRRPSAVANKNDMFSGDGKTRKKREELSISACRCVKREDVHIVVKFH